MALNLGNKKVLVDKLSHSVNAAKLFFIADYRGLTAGEITELRYKSREVGVQIKVMRNTLARLAIKDTMYSGLQEFLVGPTLLMLADVEPGIVARLFRDFAKGHEKLVIKALCLEGKVYLQQDLNAIANLPTKEEALAKLLSVIQAPIAKLVRTLQAPHLKLVRTLVAIREQKQ